MPQAEHAMLILQGGVNQAGGRWSLGRKALIIGRHADCDIVLSDRLVSREHAKIAWDDDHAAYAIADLGSKNGTFVNGQELSEPYPLKDGDEIQVALRFKLAFVDAGETAPLIFELPPTDRRLRIDASSRQVMIGDELLDPPLSRAQYRLLALLQAARGSVVSREEVVRQVWPEAIEAGVSEQAIDALVRRLRERLAELDPDHQYVVTVRGHGFRLDDERSAS